MEMQTTFRRLSDKDAMGFRSWYYAPPVKIFAVIILVAVLVRWIAR